jgi:hypothetical protein
MIISMNATVCGDMTMVSDGSYKIICSDQHEATQVDQAEASSCGYKKSKKRSENAVPSRNAVIRRAASSRCDVKG